MPEIQTSLLPRPRLLAQLTDEGAPRMAMLKAPAGFGKTALLQSYRQQAAEPVVWLNCQRADNDPMSLASNLARALLAQGLISSQRLEQQFGGFGIPSPDLINDSLLEVLNQAGELTLIFNDVDLIATHAAVMFLARLIDESREQVRFFFSCKVSPSLPHAACILDQRMLLLDAGALAFTPDETRQLLQGNAALLEPAQLQQLQTLTQGWPTALAYVAGHAGNQLAMSAILEDLQRNHGPLEAFFNEKVLKQQPPAAQQLLLKLALLDSFSPALMHHLKQSGENDLPADVPQLLTQPLFLMRVEQSRQGYQFHPMFRHYLLNMAQTRWPPDQIAAIRQKAAEWLWGNDRPDDAIELLLQAQHFALAAEWLAQRSRHMVRQQGQMSRFVLMMARLPDWAIDPYPVLRQNYAWCLCLAKKYHAFDDQLGRMRALRQQGGLANSQALERGLELIECASAALRDNIRGVSSRVAQWLARWHDPSHFEDASEYHFERAVAYLVHGFCCKCLSDFEHARQSLLASAQHYDAYGSPYGKAWPLAILAVSYAKHGAHHEARCLIEDALAEVNQALGGNSHVGYMLSALLAAMDYDAARLDQLDPSLQQSIKFLKEQGSTDPLIAAYQTVARLQVRGGQLQQALDTLREGIVFAEQAHLGRLKLSLLDELLCWLLRDGRLHEAERYIGAHQLGFGSADFSGSMPVQRITARARLNWLMAQQRFEMAIDLLHQLIERSRLLQQARVMAEWLLLLAVAQYQCGDRSTALLSFQSSLDIARGQGYLRLYLDQSPLVLDCVRIMLGQLPPGKSRGFAQSLLATMQGEPGAAPPLYETLTGKELEIIGLLQQGLDNRQLSTCLAISEGTLKWHLHNIYGKLQVRNRTQAVQVSRLHGLIR